MKQFIQKNKPVEAQRWFEGVEIPGITIDGLDAGPNHPTLPRGTPLSRWAVLPDGVKLDVSPGDWIVRIGDSVAVLSHEYFCESYEAVPEADPFLDYFKLSHLPYIRRAATEQRDPIPYRIDYCDVIARMRGWHPLDVHEKMSVGFGDGRRYEIMRMK